MTIVRLSPWGQLATLQNDMARFVNQALGSSEGGNGSGQASTWLPPVDVAETASELVLAFDLPGIAEEDIAVELDDNVLTISGQRERKHEAEGESFYRYERRFGAFSRSVSLPSGVSEADIAASFENGVLEVRVPKPQEPKPRRIPIGTGSARAIEGKGRRKS